MKKYFVIAREN